MSGAATRSTHYAEARQLGNRTWRPLGAAIVMAVAAPRLAAATPRAPMDSPPPRDAYCSHAVGPGAGVSAGGGFSAVVAARYRYTCLRPNSYVFTTVQAGVSGAAPEWRGAIEAGAQLGALPGFGAPGVSVGLDVVVSYDEDGPSLGLAPGLTFTPEVMTRDSWRELSLLVRTVIPIVAEEHENRRIEALLTVYFDLWRLKALLW